jgi:cyclophilin family peptidyl-prolyl cis-trans isomerase
VYLIKKDFGGMNMKRRYGMTLLIGLLLLSVCLTGCSGEMTSTGNTSATATATATPTPEPEISLSVDPTVAQKVKITMEDGQSFVIETAPQFAPVTVKNFLQLVESGFYDGLTFHRVIDDFMAQGGDPKGNGTGGSSKTIKGEFANNGYTKNTLSHTRGVVSMARSGNPNSASSQFFICYTDVSFLDGDYAAFGKVVEGMEVVDSFADVPTDYMDKPTEPIVIKTMTKIDN